MTSSSGKNYNYIGEELINSLGNPQLHQKVSIVSGMHKGLKGIVVEVLIERESCIVELDRSSTKLKIRWSRLRVRRDEKLFGASFEDAPDILLSERVESNIRSIAAEIKPKPKRKLKWIQPNIKIRVISKQLKKGNWYNKKVRVIDVTDPYTFSVIASDGEVCDKLCESDVETVLPPLENPIMMVRGSSQRQKGILKARNKKDNKVIV